MNTTEVMRDPFYSPILYFIESAIGMADREARGKSINLTDSQVRSVLIKARKQAEGGHPKLEEGTGARGEILAELHRSIAAGPRILRLQTEDRPEEDFPLSDWLLSLKTVEDSIRGRSVGAGSRGYLEFLKGWIKLPKEGE